MGKFTRVAEAIRRSKQLFHATLPGIQWFGNVVYAAKLENSSWSSTTATTTQMENGYCCIHCSVYY
jgi:hypothetical protein